MSGELLDERQVALRRDDRDMPHVGGQRRKSGLDIDAISVPSQQRIDCKRVTVMPRAA
jgi:hypothetical protein